MNDELLYAIALTRILPYQFNIQQKLLDALGSATAVYEARNNLKEVCPEASEHLAGIVSQMHNHLARAEQEIEFAQRNHIRILTRDDVDYPARLRDCQDAPILIYYRGTCDLNSRHILSIVGTRKATEYGRSFCQRFLRELAAYFPDTIIISGLAYGIDICAHRAALQNGLSTIGVLAHGLDQIYPRMHRQTAIEMLKQGGLLTEYMSQSTAEKINFAKRNRIVAGMSEATLVVESAEKGGSLITVDCANDYGRYVFAVPGRISDPASKGCNKIIHENKAALMHTVEDLLTDIKWGTKEDKKKPIQRELFPELSPDEMVVFNALQECDGKQLNQLTVETNIPVVRLSNLLFTMEMKGIVRLLSGGTYRLV